MGTGARTLLLIDDNPDHLILMRRHLSDAGFDIVGEALTPEQGASLAEQRTPDVVVMDVRLSAMEPADVARLLKEASPTSRLAIVSSAPMRDPDELLAQTGADFFLSKSSTEELIVELKRLTEDGHLHP